MNWHKDVPPRREHEVITCYIYDSPKYSNSVLILDFSQCGQQRMATNTPSSRTTTVRHSKLDARRQQCVLQEKQGCFKFRE